MQDPNSTERPSVLRWATVGAASYAGWGLSMLILMLLFPVLVLIALLGGKAGVRVLTRFGAGFLRFFFLGFLPLIGIYRCAELPSRDVLAAPGGCLFVSNHSSWIDALLVIALVPGVRLPVSTAYTHVPFIGRFMLWLGCVPLDRRSAESVVSGIAALCRALAEGEKIAVFPEGRRGTGRALLPFADVFFRAAIEAGVRVVPLVIHLDKPYLTPERQTLLTPRGASLRMRALEPLERRTGERGGDLGRLARKKIEIELGRLAGF